jgi:hypothetical protein
LSISWPLADSPAPSLLALPVGAASLDEAEAAIELWEHYSGKTLDVGQRLDVCAMLATRSDGLWAASVTGHEKPRQSGKGDSVEVVEFWGLTQRSERILHTIHDAVLLATETQSRMLSLFEHPDLRRLKSRAWKGTGQQMIEMRNGGVIWYRTRTGAGGRGLDEVDRLVVDEAQHAEPQHLNSITATQAVSANPQLNALGTGGLDGKSGWWWRLRKQAKGKPGAFAYIGFSAQPWSIDDNGRAVLIDIDPTDRDLWWQTIPGLVAGRVSIDFLERELTVLGPDGFAQEYLCVWAPDPNDVGGAGLGIPNWHDLARPTSTIVDGQQWAVAVSDDRQWASLGKAGRNSEGAYHVEWMEHRPGTGWIVPMVADYYRQKPIAIRVHKSGPEASLIPELVEAGVQVVEVSSADVARATGQIIDAAANGRLAHIGQPSLDKSVAGAVLRTSTDGASVWSQLKSSIEITPLLAVTVALGGVATEQHAEPNFRNLADFLNEE